MSGNDSLSNALPPSLAELAHLHQRKYPGEHEQLDRPEEVGENVGEGGDGCGGDEVKLKFRK